MPIVETELYGIVAHLGGGLRAWPSAYTSATPTRRPASGKRDGHLLLASLVVACGTRAIVPKQGKIEVALMTVGPGDVYTRAGFHVDLHGGWFTTGQRVVAWVFDQLVYSPARYLENSASRSVPYDFFSELQQSPGGMGLPWGQVVGWPRKLQIRSSSSGLMMCSNLQAWLCAS